MKGRPLHTDEIGRARNIAAKPCKLGGQIIPLERFAASRKGNARRCSPPKPVTAWGMALTTSTGSIGSADFAPRLAAGEDHDAFDVVA